MSRSALVVHPDATVTEMVRHLLVDAGFETITASSALDALDRLAGEQVDVVVLGLGDVDDRDLEAAAIFRRRWISARLIVLLPETQRRRASRVVDLGVDAYLPEPFHPAELVSLASPGQGTGVSASATTSSAEVEAVVHERARRAVEDLAGRVAHHVRNPLQILELLVAGAEMGDELDVHGFRKELRRIGAVVDELTHASGGNLPAGPGTIDVNELVRSVFRPTVETNGLQIEVELENGFLPVRGSAKRLGAALTILWSRAQKVSPSDGTVRVSTSRRSGPEGPWTEILVEDGGEAPDETVLGRMFGGASDDEPGEGADFELDAFARIIRDHGGRAEARRGRRSGTLIVAALPSAGSRN